MIASVGIVFTLGEAILVHLEIQLGDSLPWSLVSLLPRIGSIVLLGEVRVEDALPQVLTNLLKIGWRR